MSSKFVSLPFVNPTPDPTVVINADEKIVHGRVIEVMDHVRVSGISKMAIATKTKEKRQHEVTSSSMFNVQGPKKKILMSLPLKR